MSYGEAIYISVAFPLSFVPSGHFFLLFRVDFRCPFYLFFPSALLHTSPERALIAMPAGKSEQDRTYRTDIRTFLLWQ